MDVNATLEEIRRLTATCDLSDAQLERLVVLVRSLDEWISSGGFLPKAWTKENK